MQLSRFAPSCPRDAVKGVQYASELGQSGTGTLLRKERIRSCCGRNYCLSRLVTEEYAAALLACGA
jgi:hypothetical protein